MRSRDGNASVNLGIGPIVNLACTIVARNYLPHARLLAKSFRRHHPEDLFVCLVTDVRGDLTWDDETLDLDKNLRLARPSELRYRRIDFRTMAYMYDVMELATALKPILLHSLMREYPSSEAVTYLDPDTYVYGPIPTAAGRGHVAALLTPHRLTPPPQDESAPAEGIFLTYGTYNLGYISVNRAAHALLEWWGDRLSIDAVSSHRESLYTDQKWMDLAPTYFPVGQVRDPAVNLAWWNLDERRLRVTDNGVTVNGAPVKLVHYSGFRPGKSRSTVNMRADRPSLETFLQLAGTYVREVEHDSHLHETNVTYGHGFYVNGTPVTAIERRLFRAKLRRAYLASEPPPAPPWDHPPKSLRKATIGTLSRAEEALGREIPVAGVVRRWQSLLHVRRRRLGSQPYATERGLSERTPLPVDDMADGIAKPPAQRPANDGADMPGFTEYRTESPVLKAE